PVIAPRFGTRRERRPMPHDPIAAKSPFDHNLQGPVPSRLAKKDRFSEQNTSKTLKNRRLWTGTR
ncbi:hypothetical protein, partial [Sinorhizobium meliloti]|uniref:hypothetical protein n=1 Tax=Rhizobium meliloti TaxID=382 RepID=UPI001AECF077